MTDLIVGLNPVAIVAIGVVMALMIGGLIYNLKGPSVEIDGETFRKGDRVWLRGNSPKLSASLATAYLNEGPDRWAQSAATRITRVNADGTVNLSVVYSGMKIRLYNFDVADLAAETLNSTNFEKARPETA